MAVTLVLGGARSGKSGHAEQVAAAWPGEVLVVATGAAIPGDGEWAARIAAHRTRRPTTWRTVEEEVALREVLGAEAREGRLLLVECLTTWLANLLYRGLDAEREGAALAPLLPTLPGAVVAVANEVGCGIVPEPAPVRRFRDLAGALNQRIAAVADRVVWLVAGIPVVVKGERR